MENYLIDAAAMDLVRVARNQNHMMAPKAIRASQIHAALRYRRKALLGTNISVRRLVQTDSLLDDNKVCVLSRYLARRSAHFWSTKREGNEEFCYRFYRLCLSAIGGGKIAPESIDDVIELADCLGRSQEIFSIAMQEVLPESLIPELFDLVDVMSKNVYLPTFPEAILSGVATLSGYMSDPLANENNLGKEDDAE